MPDSVLWGKRRNREKININKKEYFSKAPYFKIKKHFLLLNLLKSLKTRPFLKTLPSSQKRFIAIIIHSH